MPTLEQSQPQLSDLASIMRSQHTDCREHSIISFLERPQILQEGTWKSDRVRNKKFMDDVFVPSGMITKTMFADKLKGFTSFRATAVITVQFQSQPFQAGRAMISSCPLPDLIPERWKFQLDTCPRAMLLNHVQCDISKETQVTLKIPFVSPYNSYDLVSKVYDWAVVRGLVYSPVVTGSGAIDVDFVVYGHFEDIQLGCPTSAYLAQVNDAIPRQRAKEGSIVDSVGVINDTIGQFLPFATNTTNFIRDKILEPVNRVAGPLLGLFGFSKPTVDLQKPLVLRPGTTFATTFGVDTSQILSLSEETNVPFVPAIDGSNVDEMSFDYLKKIPQYFSDFKYSTSSSKSVALWQKPVHPHYELVGENDFSANVGSVGPVHNTSIPQPINLSYISSPFKYWSGGLIYTFKFIKTDFHSGRLEFLYIPFSDYDDKQTVPDLCYRLIVDLRDKTEVSFKIPFISQTPYKRNGFISYQNRDVKYSKIKHGATGTLVVRAMTALKANPIVSSSIDVIVEINAATDFNVIAPVQSIWTPFTPEITDRTIDNNTGEVQGSLFDSDELVAQSGGQMSISGQANPREQAVDSSDPPALTGCWKDNPDLSVVVSGEVFSNFRNLIKRTNFAKHYVKNKYFKFNPNKFLAPPILAVETVSPYSVWFPVTLPTPLSYVGGMYALYRGSIRFKAYASSKPDLFGVRLTAAVGYPDTYTQFSERNITCPLAIEQPPIKGVCEFSVPYYSNVLSASFRDTLENNLFSTPRNTGSIGLSSESTIYMGVSAGDDFDFSIFIGTPPCYYQGSDYKVIYRVDPFVDYKEEKATGTIRTIGANKIVYFNS